MSEKSHDPEICGCGSDAAWCPYNPAASELAPATGSDLTAAELRWIKRAKRLMRAIPKGLRLYNIDWGITVCKKGVASSDFSTTIDCPLTSGTMLTDIHDDNPENGHNDQAHSQPRP